jgi:Transposase.
MRSLSELVARSSSEFPWANATNPIAPVCLIIVLCLLKWTRVLLARRIFQRLRMGDFHEKHTYMKFCFKLGKSFRRLFEMLEQAFGDEAMSRTQTHEWCKCFKEVQNSVEDNDRSWPTSTYKKWRKHPKSSKGDSFKSSSDTLWSSRRSWNLKKKVSWDSHWIFWHASCCSQICAAPSERRSETKSCLCQLVHRANADDNFLNKTGTGYETWVYGYVETKAQSSHWVSKTSPRPPQKSMAISVRCESDIMIFYCQGVIHHEFLTGGQTAKKEYYLKVIKSLREAVRRKRYMIFGGEKMVARSWQGFGSFLRSDSWFFHKTSGDARPPKFCTRQS